MSTHISFTDCHFIYINYNKTKCIGQLVNSLHGTKRAKILRNTSIKLEKCRVCIYYQMWEGQYFKIETIRKNIICLNVQSTNK